MKSKIAALFAYFCFVASLFAQSQEEVSLKVDLVAWGNPIHRLCLKSEATTPHSALSFTYSKSIPYSGPALMEIHQVGAVATEVPEGAKGANIHPELLERRKKSPTLVALAAIPSGASRATVLLSAAAGGLYQAYVINCDPTKVPVGKLTVLNLSSYKTEMRFSGVAQPRELTPKASMVASPGSNQEVAYALSYLDAEEWITQESNTLPIAKDEQTLMIILKSNSELFRSSFGGARGFLQIVTLRRGPREASDVALISEAEEAAAIEEAERANRENDKNVSREQKRVQPKQQ